ncbi:hypothetical protein HWD35_10525 [Tsukamurella tyrosinosolvens]|uniref:hypothetical protein n=1 Tax=Tsukamurella tyrosinosolvens TaxID=57704 RepID=UPI001CE0F467|nr:hypothetical protein [Tsukamurella tyrosinosolvens]MCA4995147.1 hypothetical protein [Tsukamurella tyrosinosolvens]
MKTRKQTTKRTTKKTTKTAVAKHVPVVDVPQEATVKVRTPIKRTRPLQAIRKTKPDGTKVPTAANQVKAVVDTSERHGLVIAPKRPLGTPPKQDPRTARIHALTAEVEELKTALTAAEFRAEQLKARSTPKVPTARVADLEATLQKREDKLAAVTTRYQQEKMRADYLQKTSNQLRRSWLGRRLVERAQERALLEDS